MLNFEINVSGVEYDIIVDDPNCISSWVKGLSQPIKDCSNEHYHQDYWDDISLTSEEEEKVAELYHETAQKYLRFKKNGEDCNWKSLWTTELIHYFPPADIELQWDGFLVELEENLIDILSDNNISINIEEIISRVSYEIESIVASEDNSSVYDAVGSQKIKLVYIPGSSVNEYMDSYDIYMDGSYPSLGDISFIKLTGSSVSDYMHAKSVDMDSSCMRKWVEAVKETQKKYEYINEDGAPIRINSATSQVQEIVDNSYMDGDIPCWVGSFTINQLADHDPSLPFAARGGCYGLINFDSGSGYVNMLAEDDGIVIEPEAGLRPQGGRSVESIFDLSDRDLEVKIISHEKISKVELGAKFKKRMTVQLSLVP